MLIKITKTNKIKLCFKRNADTLMGVWLYYTMVRDDKHINNGCTLEEGCQKTACITELLKLSYKVMYVNLISRR
jgi:hypothetical protein